MYAAGEAPEQPYLAVKNPLSPERAVMRRSLLASVLDVLEKNARLRDRLTLFEIGPVFLPVDGQTLPVESLRLAIAMTGLRLPHAWDSQAVEQLDFYDLKGLVEGMLESLHISPVSYTPGNHPAFHPGKCAQVCTGQTVLGVIGELHPLVKDRYDFQASPVLAAEIDLQAVFDSVAPRHEISSVPVFPPVLEDLAVVVAEEIPAAQVEAAIRKGGGPLLVGARLFDIYRGEQIGAGNKSLAYSLAYQAPDHTLTAAESAQVRQKIIRHLEQSLGARLRA